MFIFILNRKRSLKPCRTLNRHRNNNINVINIDYDSQPPEYETILNLDK